MPEVTHQPERNRYVLTVDGTVAGRLDYSRSGEVLLALHAEVDPSYGGRGYGGELVRQVLDDVRRQGLRVEPVCPFVAYYMGEHPEYADLRSDLPGQRGAVEDDAWQEAASQGDAQRDGGPPGGSD